MSSATLANAECHTLIRVEGRRLGAVPPGPQAATSPPRHTPPRHCIHLPTAKEPGFAMWTTCRRREAECRGLAVAWGSI